MPPEHGRDLLDAVPDLLFRAVQLAQQQGRGIRVVARTDEILRGLDGMAVHHLEPGRDDPLRDDGTHGIAGVLEFIERRQDHLAVRRYRR